MPQSAHRSVFKAIVVGGIVAALLDILDPIIFYGFRGVAPIRILQSVASGIFGREAFAHGLRTALIGLCLHILIALFWATIFVLAARHLPILRREAIRAGLFYGLFVYLVMNYLVLPHSHVSPSHPTWLGLLNGVLAIVLLVGLPISLINRRLAPIPRVSSN